jgi:hypothetical protein
MTAAWHGFPQKEDLKNIKTRGNKHTSYNIICNLSMAISAT